MSESLSNEDRAIRLGVSACLLGSEVRFDGGHKRDRFIAELLDRFIEWVPVCPEVEVGMSTPRPAMRLIEAGESVRMVEIKSGVDHTRAMRTYSERRVRELKSLDLHGYILKKNSPSCGMTRVKIYRDAGMPSPTGRGLYATALMEAYPNLPVEDEGRLNDAKLRENFIERVFAYVRLRELFHGRWTAGQVVKFHTAHKLQLMAHSTDAYRHLGRLVATVKEQPRALFREQYEAGFMAALAPLATPGRNANMLQHAAGHLKKALESGDRSELAELIHDYRNGLVPLIVPMTLIRHHARRQGIDYLNGQIVFEPHPKELMLRNHV